MTGADEAVHELWSLVRMDIRTPTTNARRPVARAELKHAHRGRVTGLANGCGPMDALFNAISSGFGVDGIVSDFRANLTPDGFRVELELKVDKDIVRGAASAGDLVEGCAKAYLAALQKVNSTT